MIEGIMDFVFNNLFIVIIAIAIISNLVSSSKKTQRQNEQRESQGSSSGESQTRNPESLESKIERNLKKFENVFEDERESIEEKAQKSKPLGRVMTSSIEEQRKEQKESLAKQYRTNVPKEKNDKSQQKEFSDSPKVISHHIKKSGVSKQALKKRISNKGLQESIIMAEVLGKPRSLKPYKPGRSD